MCIVSPGRPLEIQTPRHCTAPTYAVDIQTHTKAVDSSVLATASETRPPFDRFRTDRSVDGILALAQSRSFFEMFCDTCQAQSGSTNGLDSGWIVAAGGVAIHL